jgi:hypothetical protein
MTHWRKVGQHVSSAWDEFFLDQTKNGVKIGFEPATTWSSKAFTIRLLLRLCCCASYYSFVLCSGVLIQESIPPPVKSSQHENES